MENDRKKYIKFGGIFLIEGYLSVIIADIVGILIYEDHNPVRQTISQLAHGKYASIQDIGLVLLGLGIVAGAISLYL